MNPSCPGAPKGRASDKDDCTMARRVVRDAIGRMDAVAQGHLALQRNPDLTTVDLAQMVKELCTRVGQLMRAVRGCARKCA